MTTPSQIDLLNQSGYFLNFPRAFLEVTNIVDFADFDEGILRRIGAGAGVVVTGYRQRARGGDLSIELHQLGNGRLPSPWPKRHQNLHQIPSHLRRVFRQFDDLSRRRARATQYDRHALVDHLSGDPQDFLPLIAGQHGIFGRFYSSNGDGVTVGNNKIDFFLHLFLIYLIVVIERCKASADNAFDGFCECHSCQFKISATILAWPASLPFTRSGRAIIRVLFPTMLPRFATFSAIKTLFPSKVRCTGKSKPLDRSGVGRSTVMQSMPNILMPFFTIHSAASTERYGCRL